MLKRLGSGLVSVMHFAVSCVVFCVVCTCREPGVGWGVPWPHKQHELLASKGAPAVLNFAVVYPLPNHRATA